MIDMSFLKYLQYRIFHKQQYTGPFPTWEEAKAQANGYDNEELLDSIVQATTEVQNGSAYFERDGVAFAKPKYRLPVIASLLYISQSLPDYLRVLDIGGGLGSLYYPYKNWHSEKQMLLWRILEQPKMCEKGERHCTNNELVFFDDYEQCTKDYDPHVILLSSSLQYFAEPYKLLEKLISLNAPYIIFDRTPFINSRSQIMCQNAIMPNYTTSYPCWLLEYDKVQAMLAQKYKLFSSYPVDEKPVYLSKDKIVTFKGEMWHLSSIKS